MESPAVLRRDKTQPVPKNSIERAGKAQRSVFDIGMNNGDDSAYYLSKGYRVVAVEANPTLVERARTRFKRELITGQLVIESVGIVDRPGKILFWINEERDTFSSFDRAKANRNGMKCHPVEVECVTFDYILKKYGTPYYLKLDAEGAEASCLRSLGGVALPEYISAEAERFDHLLLLWQLGYRQFKIVDQMQHNTSLPKFGNDTVLTRAAKRACWYADRLENRLGLGFFERGCSGPFGEDTSGSWRGVEEVAYEWLHLHFGEHKRGSLNHLSWHDFHAKRSPSP